MSPDARLRRLASFWGLFALLVCLRVMLMFVKQLNDELADTALPVFTVLRDRIAWLRPSLWRGSALTVYAFGFLGVAGGICAALWGLGFQRWWRERRAARGGE